MSWPVPHAVAQTTTGERTNQEHGAILEELREIRRLLERVEQRAVPKPHGTTLKLQGLSVHVLGQPSAPLTIVEFTDLECPFCRQFHLTTFDQLRKDYIDTGKLRYVAMDFPLDIHANANAAARAVQCSADQGEFWAMRSALLRTGGGLSAAQINKAAKSLGLNTKLLATCASSKKYDSIIQANRELGESVGVSGTPSFVVGRTTDTGVDGTLLVGALRFDKLKDQLEALLSANARPSQDE